MIERASAFEEDYSILRRTAVLIEESMASEQSIRSLVEYLERRPESIISGKERP